jgi:hypothetical protein
MQVTSAKKLYLIYKAVAGEVDCDGGILAHGPSMGFLHLRFEGCVRDTLVAFSCKRRGICAALVLDADYQRRSIDRSVGKEYIEP